MDLLFKRYASPFILLDTCIDSGRLSDFILELIEIHNEEIQWEFYIHRVHDKSFEEFKKSLQPRSNKVDDEQLEATILDSSKILEGFIPQ